MKFKNLFKRNKRVDGITASDWVIIYNKIMCEYVAAKEHQKSVDAEPSAYMRGLKFALNTLDAIRPYNIMEVQ